MSAFIPEADMMRKNWTEHDLHTAEAHVKRGEEIIALQRQRIERIEQEGGEAVAARQTLALMEIQQQELIEHRDLVATALNEFV